MMNEKRTNLTALVESFNNKASNVESRLQELNSEQQSLQAQFDEAKATYENVIAQVSMGTQGYSNKNAIDSKKKLSQLQTDLQDVQDVIATLEAAKSTELPKFVPEIEAGFKEYADAYHTEVILPLHEEAIKAKIMYLAAISKVKSAECETIRILNQEVRPANKRAGVAEADSTLRHYAPPTLNISQQSLDDKSTFINSHEFLDVLAGKAHHRVDAFLQHGKLFLKSEDARLFIIKEQETVKKDGE